MLPVRIKLNTVVTVSETSLNPKSSLYSLFYFYLLSLTYHCRCWPPSVSYWWWSQPWSMPSVNKLPMVCMICFVQMLPISTPPKTGIPSSPSLRLLGLELSLQPSYRSVLGMKPLTLQSILVWLSAINFISLWFYFENFCWWVGDTSLTDL